MGPYKIKMCNLIEYFIPFPLRPVIFSTSISPITMLFLWKPLTFLQHPSQMLFMGIFLVFCNYCYAQSFSSIPGSALTIKCLILLKLLSQKYHNLGGFWTPEIYFLMLFKEEVCKNQGLSSTFDIQWWVALKILVFSL